MEGSVPADANPFFIHSTDGSWSGATLKLKPYKKFGLVVNPIIGASKSERLEIAVKAGWSVRIEVLSKNWGYFSGGGNVYSESETFDINTYETGFGGDSILVFNMHGGASLAIKPVVLPLRNKKTGSHSMWVSNDFKDRLTTAAQYDDGKWKGPQGMILRLTSSIEYVVGEGFVGDEEIRVMDWKHSLQTFEIKLLDAFRHPTVTSAAGGATSESSDMDPSTDTYNAWYEIATGEFEGASWVVAVGLQSDDETWDVLVNGVVTNTFDNNADASTFADIEVKRMEEEGPNKLEKMPEDEETEEGSVWLPGGEEPGAKEFGILGLGIGGVLLILGGGLLAYYFVVVVVPAKAAKTISGSA